eukprot:snap_masked-scaffold_7-processed-gene-2.46-mRNA-1 protein AED:1.00 eAED:1.00 QI:0/0/0/0/1/1/3/0/61
MFTSLQVKEIKVSDIIGCKYEHRYHNLSIANFGCQVLLEFSMEEAYVVRFVHFTEQGLVPL